MKFGGGVEYVKFSNVNKKILKKIECVVATFCRFEDVLQSLLLLKKNCGREMKLK